jgi:hypothetical protein
MEKIETIEHEGYRINVYSDPDPQSPDEWKDENLFLTGYDSRNFWVEREGFTEAHIRAMLAGGKYEDGSENSDAKSDRKAYRIFMLHPYTHSGTTLRLGGYQAKKWTLDEAYGNRIDGVVLVARSEWNNERKALDAAAGLVNEWNDYLSGSVYGYMIETPDGGGEEGGCWGFSGYPYTHMLEDAKAEVEAMKKDRDAKRQEAAEKFIEYGTVYDNAGQTVDRYTIVFDKEVYGMSANPKSPQGFNQSAGSLEKMQLENNPAVGERVMFSSLPEEVQGAIIERVLEAGDSQDYIWDPEVCSSSLREDGRPMTPGETAHIWDEETGTCNECGATKD